MKVKSLPFVMQTGPKVVLAELWHVLTQRSGDTITSKSDRERRLYFVPGDPYHSGLVLSMREHKSFVQAENQANGKIRLRVDRVGAGNELFDFNHFIVHKETGRGIYQHYDGACYIGACRRLLKPSHDELLRVAQDTAMNAASPNDSKRKILRAYSIKANPFVMEVLASKETYEDLLQSMKRVSAYQYEVSTLETQPPSFLPLSDTVRVVRNTISFKPKTEPKDIAARLKAIIDVGSEKKIVGVDFSNDRLVINLGDSNKLSLDSFDFDDVTKGLTDDPEQFQSSNIIRDLKDLAAQPRIKAMLTAT